MVKLSVDRDWLGGEADLRRAEPLALVGSGRTELLRSIFAADPVASGTMQRNGAARRYRSPKDAIADKIGFVTEDRKYEGLILSMSIASNVTLACIKEISTLQFLNEERETDLTRRLGGEIKLKFGKPEDAASTLSGGNQQKVVLAKWLATKPQILLLKFQGFGKPAGRIVVVGQAVP